MIVSFRAAGKIWRADMARFHDISIPVRFDDVQLSVFGTPPATMKPLQAGDFTGAVARGGSCNCETYTVTPHCNGTHTECVGHITGRRIAVTDVLADSLLPAHVVTVTPGEAGGDRYRPMPQAGDVLITRAMMEAVLAGVDPDFLAALVVRTRPNGDDKVVRDYNAAMPAYFTHEAMAFIAGLPVRHLLVDMPSVDRLADEGRLGNHRIFWGIEPEAREAAPVPRTITELVYVPDAVADGKYLLNLQVAPFKADAAPSRPVLYEVDDDGVQDR